MYFARGFSGSGCFPILRYSCLCSMPYCKTCMATFGLLFLIKVPKSMWPSHLPQTWVSRYKFVFTGFTCSCVADRLRGIFGNGRLAKLKVPQREGKRCSRGLDSAPERQEGFRILGRGSDLPYGAFHEAELHWSERPGGRRTTGVLSYNYESPPLQW